MVKVTKLKPKPRKILLPFGRLGRKGRRSARRDGLNLYVKTRVESSPKKEIVLAPDPHVADTETLVEKLPVVAPGRSILKKPFSFMKSQEKAEQGKKIKFCPTVQVHQFSLRAGGSDCVPQDGTNLAIGLGDLLQTTSHPLCPKRKQSRNCGDGVSFLTVAQRRRLIAASEGRNAKALAAHRAEIDEVQRSRALVNMDSCNFHPMVSSLQKAHERAKKLSLMLQKSQAPKSPSKDDVRESGAIAVWNNDSCLKRPAACISQRSEKSKNGISTCEEGSEKSKNGISTCEEVVSLTSVEGTRKKKLKRARRKGTTNKVVKKHVKK